MTQDGAIETLACRKQEIENNVEKIGMSVMAMVRC